VHGGNRINELAVSDFLFDLNAIYMEVSTTVSPLKAISGLVGFFKMTAAAVLDI